MFMAKAITASAQRNPTNLFHFIFPENNSAKKKGVTTPIIIANEFLPALEATSPIRTPK